MAFQLSVALRNAKLAAHETTIGASAKLLMYTGTMPSTCEAAATGTLIATMNLPADWRGTPANGVVAKLGTWETLSATTGGTVGYFRVCATDGTTCHEQGNITATGGGGAMTIDNVVVATGQAITVTSYTLTEGNA